MSDFAQLDRVAFRAETFGKLKELRGYQKGHNVPEGNSPYARKFVAKIAAEDMQADLDRMFQILRETFNFKRKQIESSIDESSGVIRTPRFHYSVQVLPDPSDSSHILWRRELTALSDPLAIREPEFQSVFGNMFTMLVFEFAVPIAIEKLIDQLEEEDRPGLKLKYTGDLSHCEITVKGFAGSIRIDQKSLLIEGQATSTAASLFDMFLAFLERMPRERLQALR
ncbi:MAG: hypothetical protein K8T89_04650 [Planctomycetes bacterium]|nr:hypothetical protein [Planctomycetota bacterium]